MSTLFFDTETTGFVMSNLPASDPKQPKLVQLGAILYDDDDVETSKVNVLVQPLDDWEYSPGAVKTHGISKERAAQYGINYVDAFYLFKNLVDVADTVVAHNTSFDKLVMEHMAHICDSDFEELFAGKEMLCTMKSSTNVLRIPKKVNPKWKTNKKRQARDFKWPNLMECSQYYLGKTFENAHDALVDVSVCADIYYKMIEMDLPLHD